MGVTLREIAEGIAEFIETDNKIHDCGMVTVVVEDKADFYSAIAEAIGQMGVCVTVAVTGFTRYSNSPLTQGTLELQISCFEHPTLNRGDPANLTAQGAMERIAEILHYRRFPFLANQLLLKGFRRDDTDEANVVRGDFEVNTLLGYRKVQTSN